MKIKSNVICTAGSACLIVWVSACDSFRSSNREPATERMERTATNSAVSVAVRIALKKAIFEDRRVRAQKEPRDGAYFVEVEQDELSYFTKFFEANKPRVDLSVARRGKFQNLLMEDEVAVDRITKKPAVVYGVQNIRVIGNRAEAELLEYWGVWAMTAHIYKLERHNGIWKVREHSQKSVV